MDNHEKEGRQNLYVIHSRSGHFLSDAMNPSSEARLILHDVDPDVVYFNSIPVKRSGQLNLNQFISEWHERFTKVDPNAGFIFYHSQENSFGEISVTAGDPTLDPINNTLSFRLKAIGSPFQDDRIDMEEVTLFIDEVKK